MKLRGYLAALLTVCALTSAIGLSGFAVAANDQYVPKLGDIMNAVQFRHMKLWFAGKAQNWALAQYAMVEIRQAFAGIVRAQPKFRGLPVGELVNAALSQPMDAVDAAIKAQDPQQFATAYAQLTAGCNACHAAADHPYVVIKAPDGSAFPNQDFNPKQ